jgi:hypothetical protein
MKTPKGTSTAGKTLKINEVAVKKRRSHDPNRGLASIPLSNDIVEKYNIQNSQPVSKGLLIVLCAMAGLKKQTLPDKTIIKKMDDFVEWVNRLVFDSGFVIISIAGVTGVGKCISRGAFLGRAMHLTCGGKTLSNKKGSHQVFCGTSSEKTAHIFADLSDAFVKNIIPALLRLGVIMPEEAPEDKYGMDKNDKNDNIYMEEADISKDPSYPLLIETARLINPDLVYRRVREKKVDNKIVKKKETLASRNEDYYAEMPLPDSNSEEEEEETETGKKKSKKEKREEEEKKKLKSNTISLNSGVKVNHYAGMEEDTEEDDESGSEVEFD